MPGPLGSPYQSGAPDPNAGGVPGGSVGSLGNPFPSGAPAGSGTGGGSSDLLGLGTYQAPGYAVNSAAFQSPAGPQGQNWNNAMQGMLGQTTGAAPTAQGPNLGQFNQNYGDQQALAAKYGQMAAGNGPSMAAVQAAQQANTNQAQALSMAQSGSAGNPALAKYQVGNQLAGAQQQASQQAVAGRTQEEMGAMQAQAGLYGQMQTGGLNAANLGMQGSQFNAQMQAQQNALNAQQYNQYTANLGQVNSQQLAANISQQQLGVQQQMQLDQIQSGAYQQGAQRQAGFMGGIMNSVGGALGLSDIRAKRNVQSATREIKQMMKQLGA